MKTKLLLATAVAILIPTSAMAQRAPAASILVVDTNRISRECTACAAASAALQAQQTSVQQREQALAGPLQTEGQAIQQAVQAAQALNGAARTNAENGLRPRVQAFEQRRQSAAQELQTLQQSFESTRVNVSLQLSRALDPIYTSVMTARGANLVLSSDARLAHAPTLDVTNEVLAQLNRTTPAFSVVPMPQQAGPAVPPPAPRPGGR